VDVRIDERRAEELTTGVELGATVGRDLASGPDRGAPPTG
jgi:hypothetical protein